MNDRLHSGWPHDRSRWRARARSVVAAWLVTGGCSLAAATEPGLGAEPNNLQLSGFGTLGLTHINAREGAGFERDSSGRGSDGRIRADVDSRLGVQANYRVATQFELVGQLVGTPRLSRAPLSDGVTLAFAAWHVRDDITVRVGRLGNDYFGLADYRNVGFAYPFVRPPVETYGNVPYMLDGADITKAWHFDETVWKLRGVAGQSKVYTAGLSIPVRPVYTLVLSRDDGNGLSLRASVSRVRVQFDSAAVEPLLQGLQGIAGLPVAGVASEASQLATAVNFGGSPATLYALGANLDRGVWIGSVEITRYQNGDGANYTSAWGLLGHRWGALTGYAVLSAIRSPLHRPTQWTAALTPLLGAAGAAQAQQLGLIAVGAAATGAASQRTATLGLRWDLSDRMALKLQWDRVRVDAYGSRLWSNTSNDRINANVGSVSLDFVF